MSEIADRPDLPDRLVGATRNPGKLDEIRAILADLDVELVPAGELDLPEVVEDGESLAENARKKARESARATGLPALADDTGLLVDALDGAPGVRSARFAGEDADDAANRRALLEALDGVDDRGARFETVCCLARPSGEVVHEVRGVLEGRITREERGTAGFGYDPIFEVDGRTLAEMTPAEKNAISHRGRALRVLRAALGAAGPVRSGDR